MSHKLKEGNALLELAILKFKDAGFSIKSLLDYQNNIKQHIELEDKYAPFKKMEELLNSQEKELLEKNEIRYMEKKE